MYNLVSLKTVLATILIVGLAAGCQARGEVMDAETVKRYNQALTDFPGHSDGIQRGLELFSSAFADLTSGQLKEKFEAAYAEELYFNDTIHIFHSREDLIAYMTRTGASLNDSRVEINQVVRDGNDVFVRWTMEFRSRAAGREVHSHSIGMTHLRFDAQGRIVLHQDFWDSGNALYAHLPIVGFAVRRARNALR